MVLQREQLLDQVLSHHGVKGMHWGVHKQQYEDAKSNFNGLINEVHSRQTRARLNSTISEEDYKSLDDKDQVLKKGSLLKRTTIDPNGDANRDRLYVSDNEKDANFYRGLLPTGLTNGFVGKSHEGFHETTLEAMKDLKSPSEKKRVDAYVELMGSKDIVENGEHITGREFLKRRGLGNLVDGKSDKDLALKYYGQLASTQGIKNDPMSEAYFKNLQRKGYDLVTDDNDRGILADNPLLTLNAKSTLRTVHTKHLTTEDVHKAQATMSLPHKRSHMHHDLKMDGEDAVKMVLSHHGVKGMKWGSRKGSSSSSSTSSKPGPSTDHETAEAHRATIKAGGVKALSNADLKQLNERMQLEQTNRDLNGRRPSTFAKGHGHVKKVLATGKTLADVYNTVNSPAGKALRKAVGG